MSFISNVSYPTNGIIGTIGGAVANNGQQWRQFENQVGQDQFEIIDNVFARTLNTMGPKPCFIEQQQQHHQQQQVMGASFGLCPRKYRIICEEGCFVPSSVRIAIVEGRYVHIKGTVEKKIESATSFFVSSKEFTKVYQLPAYVLPTKYTMFFTQHGHLVVEFPIMETTESVYPRCNTTTQYNGADAYTHAESVDVTVGMVVKGSMRPVSPVDYLSGAVVAPRFFEQSKYGMCQNNWEQQQQQPSKIGYKKFGGF